MGHKDTQLQLGENQRMDKNQRDERRRQEDIALNRGLIWVGAAIVLELLLLLVNKYYVNVYTTQASVNLAVAIRTGLKGLRIITLVGVVLCLAWGWMNLKKNRKMAAPVVMCIAAIVLFFTTHVTVEFYDSGVRMLFLLVPAMAALALVYYLYQRDFFVSAFFSGLGVVAMWMIRHKGGHEVTVYVFLALMALVLVAGGLLVNRVRGSKGAMALAGRTVQVLPKEANYLVIAVNAAVNVAAVVLALAMGATIAYYLIYVLVAWLFALLVYYTVKMM